MQRLFIFYFFFFLLFFLFFFSFFLLKFNPFCFFFLYRIGGIADVKQKQGRELIEKGFCVVENFKTAYYHAMQPVLVAGNSKELLITYITTARPAVAQKDGLLPDSPLFLNFLGEKELRIGRLLTIFFQKNSVVPLHLTSTACRQMYETEADDLCTKGLISKMTKEAVTAIGGHQGQVVRNYYVKKRMGDNVESSRQLLTALCGEELVADDIDIVYDDATLEVLDSILPGCNHPQIALKNRSTYSWSVAENKHMSRLSKQILKQNPDASKTICKRMLAEIRKDSVAIKDFHPHHILSSERLRGGWFSLCKKEEEK